MSDVQRAAALGVFVVLGGLALMNWGHRQDNPYTLADETAGTAVLLGLAVLVVGVLVSVAGLIALALGMRDLPRPGPPR